MIAGCIVLLAVLGVCTYGFILKGSDTIFPNVYVAGVNVGGLKRDAAINAVTLAVEQETSSCQTGRSTSPLRSPTSPSTRTRRRMPP